MRLLKDSRDQPLSCATPDDANFMPCDWLFSNAHRLKTIDALRFYY